MNGLLPPFLQLLPLSTKPGIGYSFRQSPLAVPATPSSSLLPDHWPLGGPEETVLRLCKHYWAKAKMLMHHQACLAKNTKHCTTWAAVRKVNSIPARSRTPNQSKLDHKHFLLKWQTIIAVLCAAHACMCSHTSTPTNHMGAVPGHIHTNNTDMQFWKVQSPHFQRHRRKSSTLQNSPLIMKFITCRLYQSSLSKIENLWLSYQTANHLQKPSYLMNLHHTFCSYRTKTIELFR